MHCRGTRARLAGGGIRPGVVHGSTDDDGDIVEDPVRIRDLSATILHLMDLDSERLSVKNQGLNVRLIGVEGGRVVSELMA